MNVSELIEKLEKVKFYYPDAKILILIDTDVLVEVNRIGPIKVIAVMPGSEKDKRLYPATTGNERRIPINSKDETETIRETHFLIT